MQFVVTEHYARGEEKIIAEFKDVDDGKIFISEKCIRNDIERKKCIYRLYNDTPELLHEVNKDNISVSHANFAESDYYFNRDSLLFLVMMKPFAAEDRQTLAQFGSKNDAHLFIAGKCAKEKMIQDNDLFFIFNGRILLETLSKNIIADRQLTAGDNQNQGVRFNPSPLSTRPLPPGAPPDSWREDEEENA